MKQQRGSMSFAGAICVALLLGLGGVPVAQADVTYSGRAFAAFVNLPTLGVGPTFIADTGELPPSGGMQSASLASVSLSGVLSAELLVARTTGANAVAESSASLFEVMLLPGHPAQVTAKLVRAESTATCNGTRGSTEVTEVTFGGVALSLDPFAPNQTVEIPGVAKLLVNEQTATSGGGSRAITVNALHLTLATGDDVILSSAHSDIKGCPGCPPPPACHDFVTGGGWITVGSSQANFGFNAGFKAGSQTPEVHLNYIDHNSGMHVKATSITVYVQGATGGTSRHFEGSAEIDGVPGYTYSIDVADNGEPGRKSDVFRLTLSTGYSAGGTLDGGNIQLHKPCP